MEKETVVWERTWRTSQDDPPASGDYIEIVLEFRSAGWVAEEFTFRGMVTSHYKRDHDFATGIHLAPAVSIPERLIGIRGTMEVTRWRKRVIVGSKEYDNDKN